uniref:Uncharacterized protein n=1 Tax=Tanacetum cinerariifolium TaxID=118510 RepID=A0A699JLG0_TANCI|nr:hypothetical protein [Tanacetum cinerariifolium]
MFFISEEICSVEILEKAHMVNYNSSRTPVNSESKLEADGDSIYDPRLSIGVLQSAKRQPTLSRSSPEAEYRGVANVVAETCWLRNLLPTGQVRVLHVPSRYQFVDIFTKGLPSALLEEFRTSLSVRCPPAPTAGEC